MRGGWHARFNARDVFVADESHRSARERRQAGNLYGAVTLHFGFNESEGIARRRDGLSRLTGDADLGGRRSANEHLARTAADETVTRKTFAALDGLEQIGGTGFLEFGVSRDRGFEIRHEVRVNGDDVTLGSETGKNFRARVDVHRRELGLMRSRLGASKADSALRRLFCPAGDPFRRRGRRRMRVTPR